mgnify:CR=1 FL=1
MGAEVDGVFDKRVDAVRTRRWNGGILPMRW